MSTLIASDASTLPWDRLTSTEPIVPWDELRQFADALAADERDEDGSVRHRLKAMYERTTKPAFDSQSYEMLYVPAIVALAAPRLTPAHADRIARWLIDRLMVAADEDADYDVEVLEKTIGALGPAALPAALDQIEELDQYVQGWYHIWALTALAVETDDDALRRRTIDLCMTTLRRGLDGVLDVDIVSAATYTLALLEHHDAAPVFAALRQRAIEQTKHGYCCASEYEEAQRWLDGKRPDYYRDESWHEPVEQWLETNVEAYRQWYESPGELPDDHYIGVDAVSREVVEFMAASGMTLREIVGQPVSDGPPSARSDTPYASVESHDAPNIERYVRQEPKKISKNSRCPCGSGRKYRKCCGRTK